MDNDISATTNPAQGSDTFYMKDGKRCDAGLHDEHSHTDYRMSRMAVDKAKQQGLTAKQAERYYGGVTRPKDYND